MRATFWPMDRKHGKCLVGFDTRDSWEDTGLGAVDLPTILREWFLCVAWPWTLFVFANLLLNKQLLGARIWHFLPCDGHSSRWIDRRLTQDRDQAKLSRYSCFRSLYHHKSEEFPPTKSPYSPSNQNVATSIGYSVIDSFRRQCLEAAENLEASNTPNSVFR